MCVCTRTCACVCVTFKQSFRDIQDYNKPNNIHAIRVPEGEEKEGRAERVCEEIVAENFPNMSKGINEFKKLNISQARQTHKNPYQDTSNI